MHVTTMVSGYYILSTGMLYQQCLPLSVKGSTTAFRELFGSKFGRRSHVLNGISLHVLWTDPAHCLQTSNCQIQPRRSIAGRTMQESVTANTAAKDLSVSGSCRAMCGAISPAWPLPRPLLHGEGKALRELKPALLM